MSTFSRNLRHTFLNPKSFRHPTHIIRTKAFQAVSPCLKKKKKERKKGTAQSNLFVEEHLSDTIIIDPFNASIG